MKRRLLTSVFSVTIFVAPLFASAQTADFSSALTRMDAIIAEMTTLRAEFASLASQVGATTPTPAVLGVTADSVLGDDLRYGSTNEDIARVQRLLATDAEIYPYGVDSGYFGPKTQEAVRRFQSRFDLDTVGVIGPSTKAMLETFMSAYPDETYPSDVLKKTAPTVSTSLTATVPSTNTGTLKSIEVSDDDDEYIVRSYKSNGDRNRDLILYVDNYKELVAQIAKKLGVSESEVERLVDENDVSFKDSKKNDAYDERDAEDAIDDADKAIDEARDAINDAEDDDKDTADADDYFSDAKDELQKAEDDLDDEDYKNAVKNAEDAIELAEKAIDAIGGGTSSDDIDTIEVRVYEATAKVTVLYDNGDDKKFTVADDNEEDIIGEIADKLDIDEDEVMDVIEFDYGDVDTVYAERDSGKTRVVVTFESGVEIKLVLNEDNEGDVIEAIADELDLDEDDIERVFDGDL